MRGGHYLFLTGHRPDFGEILDRVVAKTGYRRGPSTRYSAVLVDDALPSLGFSDGQGAVVGRLFRGGEAVITIDGEIEERICVSGPAALLDRVWGNYIAILIGPGGVRLLRDPSGALPCYYVIDRDLLAVASDAAILEMAGLLTPLLDWTKVADFIRLPDRPTSQTALVGVHELLPGFELRFDAGDATATLAWSPWDHVQAHGNRDPTASPLLLHGIIKETVKALVGHHDHILARVSGGLDSSIVAACLGAQTVPFSLLTMVAEAEGDERRYGRALAAHLGKPLIEMDYDVELVNIARCSAPTLPRPWGRQLGQASLPRAKAADRGEQNSAIVHGMGGDAVFCSLHSTRPVVDRYRSEGLTRGVLASIADMATLTGATIPEVVLDAARRQFRPAMAYGFRTNDIFLARDAVRCLPLEHPWLRAPRHALPGKQAHIGGLLGSQWMIDGYRHLFDAPLLTPLLAQPVMEFCLGVPTWRWCAGGRDRALARDAFADSLPRVLIERRSKGTPDAFAARVVETNKSRIRDRLLEGDLSSHGLLDRRRIELAFQDRRPMAMTTVLRLLQLSDAEAWVRGWKRQG